MRKKVGIIKRLFALLLVFLLNINSFAAIVSDNDGSAFITKAEFDALKSSFQSQIDSYNQSIDSKIDGAIASYLAGIKLSNEIELNNYYADWETTLDGGHLYWISSSSLGDFFDCQNKSSPFGILCDMVQVRNESGSSYVNKGFICKRGLKVYHDCYICDNAGFVTNTAERFALSQKIFKAICCANTYNAYIYPIDSTSDGGACSGGEITWSFGETRRFNSDWTALSNSQILNMDVTDWHLDYDVNDSNNKSLKLYPGNSTQGLDDSVWGTLPPTSGTSFRFAYMGMKGYKTLSGSGTLSTTTSAKTDLGTVQTAWTRGASSHTSWNSRDGSITGTGAYYTTDVDILSKIWASGATGCASTYVAPYWNDAKNELYPRKCRSIGVETGLSQVKCNNYTLPLSAISSDCMYYQGYVYGLRKNIGLDLGSIKLKWPTNLVGSEIKLSNGIPITKAQKDGVVKFNINAGNAGTLYVNKEKVSNILTDANTQTFTLAVGVNMINIGQMEKDKYVYISYKPNGTSSNGYTLTIDSCVQIVEN